MLICNGLSKFKIKKILIISMSDVSLNISLPQVNLLMVVGVDLKMMAQV